jgi:type I restriction enzyme S subunit
MTKLGDVLEFAGTPERINRPAGERFVTVRMNGGGAVERLIRDGKTPVPFTGYRVKSGQLIYSRIDARNGAFAIVPPSLSGSVVSKDFPIFDVRHDRVNSAYLWHFFRAGSLQRSIQTASAGATNRQRISEDRFLKFRIPLPPLEEQCRIAAILDRADALRAKRRRVLAYLDAMGPSIFRQMFGAEERQATVTDVATQTRTGPFGSQLLHGEFVASGVAVLGLDNVVKNRFQWAERRYIAPAKYEQLRRYTVHAGDVLISIMGTTGRCVVVPDDIPLAINTKHICAITVDRGLIEPGFLRAAFLWAPESRAHLRRQTKGSIMDGLNMGIIKAMPIPMPALSRQTHFIQRMERIDSLRVSNERALDAEERVFASLRARAFRGEL